MKRVNKETIKQIKKVQKDLLPKGLIGLRGTNKTNILMQNLMLWLGFDCWKNWLIYHKNEYMSLEEVTQAIKDSWNKAYEEVRGL